MKTTLDLPEELVKQVKLRALHEGKKLKDAFADTLRAGLAVRPARKERERVVIKKDPKTGLPIVQCPADAPARTMAVAELLAIEQESQKEEDLERLRVPVR